MTVPLLENRYRILQELGQGGFGETFLAEDLHMPSNRRCVIKQLKPVTNDPAVYQIVKDRFQREAVLLERLGEGNRQIPSLYANFTAGGQFYLVQEWIDGETLSQTLTQTGLWSSAAVSQLLVGILPVLDFIHDQGIVHRDIKPDNILLRKGDRQPVLIDFGAVKETMGTQMNTAGQTTSSIVIGTPGFMPSEQAIGRPVFSSDLYSLGLTAIYLLTGKLPSDFPSDPSTGKILWRHTCANVDNHLADVIEQAICNHPRDRFSSAGAMLQALQSSHQATIPVPPPVAIPDPFSATQATMPTSQPTVVSTPQAIAPVPVVTNTYSQPIPPEKRGMADWQKAILTGGVIGAFLLGGIILNDQLSKSNNGNESKPVEESTKPTATESTASSSSTSEIVPPTPEKPKPKPEPEPEPEPALEPEPEEAEKPVTPPTSTEPIKPINNYDAEAVVVEWLRCKSELFEYPYDRQCGNSVLTGKAYDLNIERSDGQASSVEWLENTGAYYVFENQSIDEIRDFQMVTEGQATVDLIVTEQRLLYDQKDNIDKKASGYDQRLVRYTLRWADDTWKIADYKTIEVLWEE